MGVLEAIVLGITQGVTEFLPISSDGHLILVPALLGWRRFGLTFDVILHAATLLATVTYFRKDLWAMAQGFFTRDPARREDRRLAWMVLAATVPGAVLALAVEPLVEGVETLPMDRQLLVTGWFLLGTAASLAAAELIARAVTARRESERADATEAEGLGAHVSWAQALFVGVMQGTAVAPGLSRSGVTIATGLATGLTRERAARFSFLLSVPIIAAATAKKVLDVVLGGAALPGVLPVIAGFLAALVAGYLAVAVLLRYVREHSLAPFAVYTAIVGLAVILWQYAS